MKFQPIQCRHHRREETEEAKTNFFDWMEVEFIRCMDVSFRRSVGPDRCEDHEEFTQEGWILDEHCDENQQQETEVVQPLESD